MKRIYKLNETIFDKLTPDVAYWLGFMYGDSNCTCENKIRFALADKDYSQLVRFRNFIGNDEKPIKRFESNGKPCCGFEFRSWKIHNKLAIYQITKRKENRGRLHIDLLQDSFAPHFIRGLFDADGSFYYDGLHKNNLFAEITGHMAVLKDVKNILTRFNVISVKKKIVKNGSVFRIRLAKEDTIKLISFMYADSPRYFLSRKYGMAKDYLDRLNDTALKDEATVEKYYRPMSEYNVGKRQEHADRKLFVEEKAVCSCE